MKRLPSGIVSIGVVDGLLPIHRAAFCNNVEGLKRYVEIEKQSVNRRSCHKRTPLHYAARCGSVEAFEYLMSKGADIHAVDGDGNTPLHLAYLADRVGMVDVVKQFSPRTLKENNAGHTPYEFALFVPATLEEYYDVDPSHAKKGWWCWMTKTVRSVCRNVYSASGTSISKLYDS